MASYVYMLSKVNVPVILKLGYIEFVMAGVRHSAIVSQASQLLLTHHVNS